MKKKVFFVLAIAVITMTACSDESTKSLQISPASLNLHYEDAQQLKVLDASGTVEWSTANDFHATVNASGKVIAGHVGNTIITAQQGQRKGTCSVTIKPKYSLYDTPYLGWGSTMSQVKSKLGTPDQEQANTLVYLISESKGIIAMYTFEGDKLSGVGVMVNVNNLETLTHYLIERYQLFDVEDDKYYFFDAMTFEKATLGIMYRYFNTGSTHGYQVVYAPVDHSKEAPARCALSQKEDVSLVSTEFEYLFK